MKTEADEDVREMAKAPGLALDEVYANLTGNIFLLCVRVNELFPCNAKKRL